MVLLGKSGVEVGTLGSTTDGADEDCLGDRMEKKANQGWLLPQWRFCLLGDLQPMAHMSSILEIKRKKTNQRSLPP